VPLLVGTWAPRLAVFAGEAAQELKVGGSANPVIAFPESGAYWFPGGLTTVRIDCEGDRGPNVWMRHDV
jgi:hypothetical protein